MTEKKTYNFSPIGKTFVWFNETSYNEDCVDIAIIDCDSEIKEYSVTIDEAKDLALTLLQVADVAATAKAKEDEADDE